MRFSSAIVLAVVIVLASSPNSAMPTDMSSDSVSDCPTLVKLKQIATTARVGIAWQIDGYCIVSGVSTFTLVAVGT
ncbi:hypothetical protein BDR07DRAFT_1431980, partial [Suillus spraguei]